ncbi:MAG: alanine racemase [Candidatus Scalindua sp. AMX11]|nr:MAG: alanine racemase [Candidatus Scalindua sp.]NOG85644.1 alanine racemase [Planctomycetota bacterium]RZV82461.1 MAG: alanine racemase [Candidatus Scalindua sp. SCAELEC01]TDE65614.1 MAG: alanine racemase [Candidatus Scalindua sp. AMX11]GJQ59190.1 MAG: alanine racemase [Candidatus Scalindua sp.]
MRNVTWAEISLDAVTHNFKAMRKKVGKGRKILAMVKADAYGHGAIQIGKRLVQNGVDMLGVALLDEGRELRENSITTPILLLNPILPEQIYEALKHSLIITICNLHSVKEIAKVAKKNCFDAKIHIEVDTGMGGTGIDPKNALSLIKAILPFENLSIEGVFTHFHSSEETDKSFTQNQNNIFQNILRELRDNSIQIPLIHAANSAATLTIPESHFNMVRLGLALYGIYPPNSVSREVDLKPVLSLKTRIINTKQLEQGSTVGYGRTCKLVRPTIVATIPVGYKDGLFRSFSNLGNVLINGKTAPILGRICMDRCFVDISHIPDVIIGDEVVLFGRQKKRTIRIESAAKLIDTIPHEIVCALGRNALRIYT